MSLQKSKRKIDKKLIKEIGKQPCLICFRTPSDADHVTSKGAGGEDIKSNLWPLCRMHHTLRHTKGLGFMVREYECLRVWLRDFERFDILDKYITNAE